MKKTGSIIHRKPVIEAKSSKSADSARGQKNTLFEKTPKVQTIGVGVRPKRDLTRYIKWPRYIRIQRQKQVLLKRLKVPPTINAFRNTLDKSQASQLLRLLSKYKPETRQSKKSRIYEEAKTLAAGKSINSEKPVMLKYGLNHVTDLVEIKKAKLVVIAHDVEPLELVLWLPALCRTKDVAYCIIKGKSRLGKLVHKKKTCVLAIDNIRKEDQAEFDAMCKAFKSQFNNNVDLRRKYGGGLLGFKSQMVIDKRQTAIATEQAKKLGAKT